MTLQKGVPKTPEHKAALSVAMKASAAHRVAMASPEVRARLSAAKAGERTRFYKDGRTTLHPPTYNSWRAMLRRCGDLTNPRYGGRGIKVCAEWVFFDTFLADMGVRPIGMTLDRIDNDGHYEPGNCRWATPGEQNRNQRKAKRWTLNLTVEQRAARRERAIASGLSARGRAALDNA